jgi:hypothetical protein
MGVLAVDLTAHGVVMSADSQPVEIVGGENRIDDSAGRRVRNPILQLTTGGFVGLVGFAGTERVERVGTSDWLRRFARQTPNDELGPFCKRLAETLTEVWRRDGVTSVLEILVTGEIGGEVQFWFVRNSQGLRADGTHEAPADVFTAQDDLNAYLKLDGLPGEGKTDLVTRRPRPYSFWQGVLMPSSPVFDAFSVLLSTLVVGRVKGFDPIDSLDGVGQFARVRMEFLKRLCSPKHGIYNKNTPTPIDGDVHVYGVGLDGRVCEYKKHSNQVETHRHGRG